jgi:Novel STAND NTPase 1/TIR domain/Trypsin-like peptidase domain
MQESLEASFVRIHTADGHVVGAGFLVGERHILTCAHVVAGALGVADDTPEKPQAQVALDVPRVAPGKLLSARVVLWRPPRADGGDDIAGLELLDDPPQGAQAAPLAQVENLWEHSFRAFGFPRGQDSGVWATGRLLGPQLTDWVQIEDVKETGFAVGQGFSGTPVWDPQVEAVVGMVVAAEKRMNLKTAFAIPVNVLARSWPLLESLIHPFVFLCYARADSELVTRLKTDLLSQGVHVWIDREGLQPGTLDWEEAVRTAIRSARAVLLIASPNARSSRYVRDELRIAEMYRRPVYPLWVAGTQWMDAVPLGYGGAQYIDARERRYETAIPELVVLLNKASSASRKPPELDFEPRNPYKGLHPFTGDDAHDFFGRDRLINDLAASLEEALTSEEKNQQCARLLAVVGPSGSGKSSVAMAGLLPRLREGKLPGSEQWIYLDPIVPGSRPIENLALMLSDHLPYTPTAIREELEDDAARGLHLLATKLAKRAGTKVVLFVDQFEELFTQTPSEDERRHFLDLLVTAITEPHGQVIVLLTLRADFYDRPMLYPELGQLIDRHHKLIFPMKLDELRATIEQPAALRDVRLTFEGDLVGDLLFEVQGQVGALPLLQFTLDQLFQRRSGRQLTLSAYRELGGVKGALAKQAEKTYTELPSDEHRKLACALFVRLIDPGASEQDTTRRRAALSEFSLEDAIQTRLLQEVADSFIKNRLLTTNEIAGTTTIEVSHEALIREWPRLAGWLKEAREDIPLQQAVSTDVEEWERRGKPKDRLYRGTQLKEAQAWAGRYMVSERETAFLRASVRQRQHSSLLKMTVILLILILAILTGFLEVQPLVQQLFPLTVTSLKDDGQGSLRAAIQDARPNSTIQFSDGLKGQIIMLTQDLTLNKSITLIGPGVAISSGNHDFRIIVDAGFSVSIDSLAFKNSVHKDNDFIHNSGNLVLNNISISDNIGVNNNLIYNDHGQLTITNNSTISNNTVNELIYNDHGQFTITNNSTISNNIGRIHNFGDRLNIINNSTISDMNRNSPNQNSGNHCPIYNEPGGSLIISNSTIKNNISNFNCGSIYNVGQLTIIGSTISGNSTSGSSSDSRHNGGGIANQGGTLTITNSTINGNTADYNGGGIVNLDDPTHNGTVFVTNSTIAGNRAGKSGGGIANLDGTTHISFCTIYGNSASAGGGIAVKAGSVTMRNSNVVGNDLISRGQPSHPNFSGMLTSGGFNLIQNIANIAPQNNTSAPDTSNIAVPRFTPGHDTTVSASDLMKIFDPQGLQNNGGRTRTYKLLPGAGDPAIDAIPLATCQVADILDTATHKYVDQRDMSRPDNNEQSCDIGAYESSG